MLKQERKVSQYDVHILDFTPLHKLALQHVNQDKTDDLSTDCKPIRTFGYVDTPKGKYVLCTEGVGDTNPVSTDHVLELEFFSERQEDGVTHMSIMPNCMIRLPNVDEYDTGETKPLHEFIRTFGSRLDMNYIEWERFFNKTFLLVPYPSTLGIK